MYAASLSKDNTLLRLSGVSKAFGPRVLFRKLGAEFKAESITLLAGSNGTGKSTLMRIMAGLGRPDSGTVERLADETETAFLAHATFIYSGLSARENLLFWARGAGLSGTEASRAADAALERVGLARHGRESFPGGWPSVSISPAYCSAGPACFCWMNRAPGWISLRGGCFGISCGKRARAEQQWCGSATISMLTGFWRIAY